MTHKLIGLAVLMVLAVFIPAQGFTTLAGKEYLEVSAKGFDCLDLEGGVLVAVDYFTPQSQPVENLQVDIGDNYVGGYLQFDVSVLSVGPATPYVAYKCLARNSTPSDLYHVLEAGIGVKLSDNITAIVAGQYCHQREDEEIFVAGIKLEW